MTATVVTLEELGVIATVAIEGESALWYEHSKVIEAFKAHGYGPLVHVSDLFDTIFTNQFIGYVPDAAFFTAEKPNCPFFMVEEYFRSKFLDSCGSWQPNSSWLLEKL